MEKVYEEEARERCVREGKKERNLKNEMIMISEREDRRSMSRRREGKNGRK